MPRAPFRFIVAVLAAAAPLVTLGCPSFRTGPAPGVDGAAAVPDATVDDATDAAAVVGPFSLVPDLPKTTYRGVYVRGKKVIIVGDEYILDYDGKTWQYTKVGGTDLYGAWTDGIISYAVGVLRQTNTGVVMLRTRITDNWVQFETVPHGLRSVWGIEGFRIAAGHDGVVYYGDEDQPLKNAVQHDPIDGTPKTVFAPILSSIAGNAPDKVVVTGGSGGWFGYIGGQWKGFREGLDLTRSFRAAFAMPGPSLEVILGSNYYGLWAFKGAKDPDSGVPIPTRLLNEERDEAIRANQFVNSIWGESAKSFVAVGTGGRVMWYRDEVGAEPLTKIPTIAGARDLWGVGGTSFQDLWIVGDDGIVMRGAIQ